MISQLHIPSYPLNRFIESFFYYKDFQPEHVIDRFLPDGNVNLVIDLTNNPKYIYDNYTLEEKQSCKNAWFSGIRTNFITIPSGKESEMFIVNFHKGRAYPFLKIPLYALTNIVIDAELTISPAIGSLREKLLESKTVAEKFVIAEGFFNKHFGNRMTANPFVEFAIEHIEKNPGADTLRALVDKVGFSQKHFISIFKKHVGITPKGFMKIIRFQKVITDLESGHAPNWSKIALESGYFDQAHFNHDFKLYSGFTPNQYIELKNENLNYVPIK